MERYLARIRAPSEPVVHRTLSWKVGADNYSPVRFCSIQMLEMTAGHVSAYEWGTLYQYVDRALIGQLRVRGVATMVIST